MFGLLLVSRSATRRHKSTDEVDAEALISFVLFVIASPGECINKARGGISLPGLSTATTRDNQLSRLDTERGIDACF